MKKNDKIKKNFGELLRERRGRKRMTQSDVAYKAFGPDGDPKQISTWENGKHLPSRPNQDILGEVLDITRIEMDAVLKGEPAPEDSEPAQGKTSDNDEPTPPKVRPSDREIRRATVLISRKIGRPFSFELLGFSMTMAQFYSVLSLMLVWVFIPQVGEFANMSMLPNWGFLSRLALTCWAFCYSVLVITEPNRVARSTARLSRSLPLRATFIACWLVAIVQPLWGDFNFFGITFILLLIGFSHAVRLLSFSLAAVSGCSVLTLHLLNVTDPIAINALRIAAAVALSGQLVIIVAIHFQSIFVLRFWIGAGLMVAVAFLLKTILIPTDLVGSLVLSTVALCLATVGIAALLTGNLPHAQYNKSEALSKKEQQEADLLEAEYRKPPEDIPPKTLLNPFQALGLTILPFAFAISALWPVTSISDTSQAIWTGFFFLFPLVNAMADFVSLSLTIHSWHFLTGSTKMKKIRWLQWYDRSLLNLSHFIGSLGSDRSNTGELPDLTSRVIAVILFEILTIFVICTLLILTLFLSFQIVESLRLGSFSTKVAATQFYEDPFGEGIWVMLVMATAVLPTILATIFFVWAGVRAPKPRSSDTGQIDSDGNYEMLAEQVERLHLRYVITALVFGIFLIFDVNYIAQFTATLLQAFW